MLEVLCQGPLLRRSIETPLLYTLFAATGVACILPGMLLPNLLQEWRLSTMGAGTLLFLVFLGSSLGALAMRGSFRWVLVKASATVALSAAGLALTGSRLPQLFCFLYGLGLGQAMTAVCLLRQHTRAERRSVELVRLNLIWALGAFVCPALTMPSLRSGHSRPLLLALAAGFAVIAAGCALLPEPGVVLAGGDGFGAVAWRKLRRVPLSLVLMTILAPAIEAAVGSWMATFAQERDHLLVWIVGAPTCFWAGLLFSRLVGSLATTERQLQRTVPWLLLLLSASSLVLVADPYGLVLPVSAFMVGASLGPLYPLLLSRAMAVEEISTIFFLAGIASSVLPWLTGAVASWSTSLRVGLAVPATAAIVCLLLERVPAEAVEVEAQTGPASA